MVAPRRPGKPHDLHRDRARDGGARERGGGAVRGDAAPGGAGHGALGDERRSVVVAGGAVVRHVEPPAREHPGRHLRPGAPGLRVPERRAGAVGVQHHPSGLRGGAAVRHRRPAPLGQQRLRHGALRRPGARRSGRAGRRGGR
uniref:Uncharacterized protein n=1 Tax=Arundo donax TaxID=35708 RepID=A0A0A9EXI2_ARUDO